MRSDGYYSIVVTVRRNLFDLGFFRERPLATLGDPAWRRVCKGARRRGAGGHRGILHFLYKYAGSPNPGALAPIQAAGNAERRLLVTIRKNFRPRVLRERPLAALRDPV